MKASIIFALFLILQDLPVFLGPPLISLFVILKMRSMELDILRFRSPIQNEWKFAQSRWSHHLLFTEKLLRWSVEQFFTSRYFFWIIVSAVRVSLCLKKKNTIFKNAYLGTEILRIKCSGQNPFRSLQVPVNLGKFRF